MQTRKVAIIDDNEDSLRELEQILEMAGYTPVLVNDIFGAVDRLRLATQHDFVDDLRVRGASGVFQNLRQEAWMQLSFGNETDAKAVEEIA